MTLAMDQKQSISKAKIFLRKFVIIKCIHFNINEKKRTLLFQLLSNWHLHRFTDRNSGQEGASALEMTGKTRHSTSSHFEKKEVNIHLHNNIIPESVLRISKMKNHCILSIRVHTVLGVCLCV